MMVDTAQIMPITQLQKTLTQTVRKISENKKPVFIMKNNNNKIGWWEGVTPPVYDLTCIPCKDT